MLVTGITGGIGSGKSLVADLFSRFGYPVYNSDARAKSLMQNNAGIRKQLVSHFGAESFIKGKLNRKFLADQVFTNVAKLDKLNSIVHPAVGEDFKSWLQYQQKELVFKEAAILIESGAYKSCDKIIVIEAPVKTRVQRVMKRDGVTEDEVLRRMQKQFTDKQRAQYADYRVNNDGSELLIPQVKLIIGDLMRNQN